MIGICTAVIGDVAGHLGCFIFLKDSVNAIAFVALGTSVPGTSYLKIRSFALKIRAFALKIWPFWPHSAKNTGHFFQYSSPI